MRLPAGQFEIAGKPRFGLPHFADRFPPDDAPRSLGALFADLGADAVAVLGAVPRAEMRADFHCVTGWSCRGLAWGGWRFADVHSALAPWLGPHDHVRMRCHDGFRAVLPLADMLAGDVILADRLGGAPLAAADGGPLRLIAPAHYGYKSAKHLRQVAFVAGAHQGRSALWRLLVHPRGRVALEERSGLAPAWLVRYAYRPLIGPVRARFAAADRRRGDRPSEVTHR